jgi:hypothetical protein
MDSTVSHITLASLTFHPYLDQQGMIKPELENKIGVYAIFNESQVLEYVGYSRNLLFSLKQHLVRQPDKCYWFKYYLIERPSRSILEEIRQQWVKENPQIAQGNEERENLWTQPINAKLALTAEEKQQYEQNDELGKIKLLKKVARRVEEKIKNQLTTRQVNMEIRFNPKLKEQGLLDLK